MSSATYRRIAGPVGYLFNTYRALGKQYEMYSNPDVRAALLKSTKLYQQYQTNRLISKNAIDLRSFLPIEIKTLEPVLAEKLDLGDLDGPPVEAMWKEDVLRDLDKTQFNNVIESPLYSDSLDSPRYISDYQARVLGVLAASCLPHSAVPIASKQAVSSFKWYLRLLANTPVVLVLKARRRLFSEDSLALADFMAFEFQQSLEAVRSTMKPETFNDSDFATRNYHFSHLSSSDLLALATRSQPVFGNGHDFEQKVVSINWDQYNRIEDTFCDIISSRNLSFLLMPECVAIPTPELQVLKRAIPPSTLSGTTDLAPGDIPYDLAYDDFYLLTIENAALRYDLEPLLDAVEASSFEVAGARVMLANEHISNFFNAATETHTTKDDMLVTYDELIALAHKARLAAAGPPSAAHALFTRLGQWNQAKVTMGSHKNCIYLGPTQNA